MPSVDWNKVWGKEYSWPADGDEWSYSFGSASVHWYAFILPRLHRFLPRDRRTARIVEIAPGHGRWTQFLLDHCETLAAYDVNSECIDFCIKRFSGHVDAGAAEFHVNDGLTLLEKSNSVDLAFSFDSLVHVERDVMQSYLMHLGGCLKPGGFAFIEHSNLGSYPHLHKESNGNPFNARGVTVSMATVQADAKKCGLVTLVQEGLNHETQKMNNELVDCISVLQKPTTPNANTEPVVVLNNFYYPPTGEVSKMFILPYETCKTA